MLAEHPDHRQHGDAVRWEKPPTVYAYPNVATLLNGESAGGAKAELPGASAKPVTDRPASK